MKQDGAPDPRTLGLGETGGDPAGRPWCRFTIGRTSWSDGRPLHEVDVQNELAKLRGAPSWDGLYIYPDAEPGPDGHWQYPRISFTWEAEGTGYVVQCFEDNSSRSSFLSVSAELSDPAVYVELGGATQELWPRELFVPYVLALSAVEYFVLTGRQEPLRSWIGISDFARKKIAARRLARRSPEPMP